MDFVHSSGVLMWPTKLGDSKQTLHRPLKCYPRGHPLASVMLARTAQHTCQRHMANMYTDLAGSGKWVESWRLGSLSQEHL